MSPSKNWPIASVSGKVDCSINAVRKLQMAAQEWHPSETQGLGQTDSI